MHLCCRDFCMEHPIFRSHCRCHCCCTTGMYHSEYTTTKNHMVSDFPYFIHCRPYASLLSWLLYASHPIFRLYHCCCCTTGMNHSEYTTTKNHMISNFPYCIQRRAYASLLSWLLHATHPIFNHTAAAVQEECTIWNTLQQTTTGSLISLILYSANHMHLCL